jgi:hypothetical protein
MHHRIRAPVPAEHVPQILDNRVGPLPRGKVAAVLMLAGEHERAERLVPQLGELHQLLGELGRAELDVGDVGGQLGAVAARVVPGLVVDALAGRRPRGREPVDADPRQDLVVRPRVAVRPVVQLLVDPRQQADRAVGHAVADRLRLRALLHVVARAFGREPLRVCVPGFFRRRQRRLLRFQEERWVRARVGVRGVGEVGVCCAAGFGC